MSDDGLLDAAACYAAAMQHDRPLDGRIFAGVVTTGVYCRPVCRVRPPRRENVRWFACAAAAEAAGFRPCRRCRPEASPPWVGGPPVVSRALRLLGGEADVAARIGVESSELERLFVEHLGASPEAIAHTRRVHFAKSLIDDTALPFAQVAVAAGFEGARDLGSAIRKTFRRSPTMLRRSGRTRGGALRLAYRPPLDARTILDFLRLRAIPGVEAVDEASYRRTIEVDGTDGAIELRPNPSEPHVELVVELPRGVPLLETVERARRIFDLDADPLPIARHLRRSGLRGSGLRVPRVWDPFELAVRAVLGQQVTVRGATTLAGRLVEAFGRPVPGLGTGLSHLFPRPADLAEADLARIGLPRARAATIRGLASAVARGRLVLDGGDDLEHAVAALCAVPGIGEWTAHYIAMRGLGQPDAFPASDLGIRRALGNGGPLPSVAEVSRVAEAWRPWRAYAVMQLWTSPHERRIGR